jgi:hypothetical protein
MDKSKFPVSAAEKHPEPVRYLISITVTDKYSGKEHFS